MNRIEQIGVKSQITADTSEGPDIARSTFISTIREQTPEEVQKLKQELNNLDFAANAFVNRCNIYSLKRDGREEAATQELANVLRHVRYVIVLIYSLEGQETRQQIQQHLRNHSVSLVKCWKDEVVYGIQMQLHIQSSPAQTKILLRKILERFLATFHEFILFITDLAQRCSCGKEANENLQRTASHIYNTLKRERNGKRKVPSQVFTSQMERSKSDGDVLMINENQNSAEDSPYNEDNIISAYGMDPEERSIVSYQASDSNGGASEQHYLATITSSPISGTSSQRHAWDMAKLQQDLDSVRNEYEQKIAAKKKKQQMIIKQMDFINKPLPPLPVDQSNNQQIKRVSDSEKTLHNFGVDVLPLTFEPLKGESDYPVIEASGPEQVYSLREKIQGRGSNESLHDGLKETSRQLKQQDSGIKKVLGLGRKRNATLGGVQSGFASASNPDISSDRYSNPLVFNDDSAEIKSYEKLVISRNGHIFKKLGVFEDLKLLMRSYSGTLSSSGSASELSAAELNKSPHLPSKNRSGVCSVCKDSTIMTTNKVQCQVCGIIMHDSCRRGVDLSMWSCE
ncbi:hypothetical protein MP228_010404 [Amoeboaphelidium protococcarum]|nr:hypothetical protein MP228_010404 [Amoeboaphelidium protococcarum]